MQKSLLVFVFFRCVLGRHDLYEFGHHPYIETVAEHTVALLGGDALWEGWGAGGKQPTIKTNVLEDVVT